MKIKLSAILLTLFLSSCISVQSTVSQHTFSSEKLKEIKGEGKACIRSFLFFVFGDATVDKAAKNGDISEVVFVEVKNSNYLLGSSSCTIVKGK